MADKETKEPKGPKSSALPVDLNLLTDEDRKSLTAEARKHVLDGMRQDARDKYFQTELTKLRSEKLPSEQYVRLSIESAQYVPFFMIDGVQFYNGYTYDVTRKVAAVLMEQMQRSWQHQEEISGRSKYNPYRRPREAKIGPSMAGTATPGFATGHRIEAEI